MDLATVKERIQHRFEELSGKGFRVLGVAYRAHVGDPVINKDDEVGMTFLGFFGFL